jgi:hypothetical protein
MEVSLRREGGAVDFGRGRLLERLYLTHEIQVALVRSRVRGHQGSECTPVHDAPAQMCVRLEAEGVEVNSPGDWLLCCRHKSRYFRFLGAWAAALSAGAWTAAPAAVDSSANRCMRLMSSGGIGVERDVVAEMNTNTCLTRMRSSP